MLSPEGTIYAEGSDDEGTFVIRGSWEVETGIASFRKQHETGNAIVYEGSLDGPLHSMTGEYTKLDAAGIKMTGRYDKDYFNLNLTRDYSTDS